MTDDHLASRKFSSKTLWSPLQSKYKTPHKPVGVGALDDPFINKIKRVFGTGEVSENSSLEKLLFLKFGFKDSRGRLSLQSINMTPEAKFLPKLPLH